MSSMRFARNAEKSDRELEPKYKLGFGLSIVGIEDLERRRVARGTKIPTDGPERWLPLFRCPADDPLGFWGIPSRIDPFIDS